MCRTLATTLLMLCCATQVVAQADADAPSRLLLFGGHSVNIDYVPNRGTLVITDRKVSPFFSHGSGPTGFQLSVTRLKRRHLAIMADLSGYLDRFTGAATIASQWAAERDCTSRTRRKRSICSPALRFEDQSGDG
jgi:hypothetical protein